MNNKKKTKKPVKKQAEEEQEEEFTGFDLDADENEYEKAMSSVRKDLFEDEDEEEEEGQGQSKRRFFPLWRNNNSSYSERLKSTKQKMLPKRLGK